MNRDDEPSTLLAKSPSLSKKGFLIYNKSEKLFDVNKATGKYKVPGPGQYEGDIISRPPPSKPPPSPTRDRGRVPFVMPEETPGPLDYHINYQAGLSKIILNKKSATFEALSKPRDQFLETGRLMTAQ